MLIGRGEKAEGKEAIMIGRMKGGRETKSEGKVKDKQR